MPESLVDKITSLTKRRGFIFPSSEIYGGINACWDYGPLGVRLKNNVKDAWMRAMVQLRDDIEPLDAAILMHPRVWEASGHVENFTDPMVDCRECKHRFRADEIRDGRCPNCRSTEIGEAGSSTSCSRPLWGRWRRTRPSSISGPRRPRASTSTSRTCARPAAAACRSASP